MCPPSSGAQSRGGAGTARGTVARSPNPLHLDAAEPQLPCALVEAGLCWPASPPQSWTTAEVMHRRCPGLALHLPLTLRHPTFSLLLHPLPPSSRLDKPIWTSCHHLQLRVRAALQAMGMVGGQSHPVSCLWTSLGAVGGSGVCRAAGVGGGRERVSEETSEGQGLEEGEGFFLLHPKKNFFALRSYFCDCPVLGQHLGCFAPLWCLVERLWRSLPSQPPSLGWGRRGAFDTTVQRKLMYGLLGRCHAYFEGVYGGGQRTEIFPSSGTFGWCLISTCPVLPVVLTGPCMGFQGPLLFLRAAGTDAKPSHSGTMLVCHQSWTAAFENPLAVFSEGLMLGTGMWKIHIVLWI